MFWIKIIWRDYMTVTFFFYLRHSFWIMTIVYYQISLFAPSLISRMIKFMDIKVHWIRGVWLMCNLYASFT